MEIYSVMEKHTIEIKHGQAVRRVEFSGTPLLIDLLKSENIPLAAPCSGSGRCGGCRVKISGSLSEMDQAEAEILARCCVEDMRLACRVRLTGDCVLTLEPSPVYVEAVGMRAERVQAAVDTGTTTVTAAFTNAESGEVLCRISELNAQRIYGADVMSRIAESEKGEQSRMNKAIVGQINSMLSRGAELCGAKKIESLVVTGNTVMLHLAANLDPAPMGRAPYQPNELFGKFVSAERTGLCADAYFMPCTGGFTGGDLTACLAAFDMENGDVLCDLGTNGELAFRYNDKYYITSAAAGPALEGGCISCGSGAVSGAISRITEIDGIIKAEVIGGGRARTICGGALISAAAIMLKRGIVDPSGRMKGEDFAVADDVRITAQDIRQLQLAKGAVAAAMLRLVQFAGADYGDVKRVVFTGGLGSFTDTGSAKKIGLIPKALDCPVVFSPVLALGGALMCLTEKGRIRTERIAAQCVPLALDGDDGFTDLFIENMEFDGEE